MADEDLQKSTSEQDRLPDDENFWDYVYDEGIMSPDRHSASSTSPDPPVRPKVSGWVENDRSLYFLHEIGMLP